MPKIQTQNLLAILLGLALTVMAADTWRASVLRPGDVLDITVFRIPEFSKSVRIEEDGCFTYPLCGVIKASGLTARKVGEILAEKLRPQIAEPHVDVFVSSWASRTVYVLGEVKGSSSLELPTYETMTALQAISSCGGFSESADLSNVAVLRRKPGTNDLERLKIDVTALVSKTSGGDDFVLQPEDTLIIPKAPPVYISGKVNSPGVFYIDTQRPPLMGEIIIRAGGMQEGADASKICIVRTDDEGKRSITFASLKSRELGHYDNDMTINPGDYILIGEADKIYVLGEVKTPGPLSLAPNQTVTASQAIALCGGFTEIAKQGDITLIRGKEMISVNLKKLYKDVDNMSRDIELQYGDILFVQESFW